MFLSEFLKLPCFQVSGLKYMISKHDHIRCVNGSIFFMMRVTGKVRVLFVQAKDLLFVSRFQFLFSIYMLLMFLSCNVFFPLPMYVFKLCFIALSVLNTVLISL